MIYTIIKSLVISFIMIITLSSLAYADFYVIPVAKKGFVDTSSGNAVAEDILSGKKAWVDGNEITGTYNGIVCSGTLTPLGRWCDNGDGTVTDMSNGLVWLKNAGCLGTKKWVDTTSWDDAQVASSQLYDGATIFTNDDCALSDGSDAGDWRLPSYRELVTLNTGIEPVISSGDGHFTSVSATSGYWTTTSYESLNDQAFIVIIIDESVALGNKTSHYSWVWPVRARQ